MTQPSPPLTDLLRSASVRKHSMSDSIVNARLVTVLVDRVLYARALSCFYWILSRIESELNHAAETDQRLVPFVTASTPLFRRDAIAQDLEYYLGPDWKRDAEKHSLSYVQAYLERLDYISSNKDVSILLAAHAFTQHQAFASGGRILASRVIPKGLGLDPHGTDGRKAFQYSSGDDAYVRAQRESVKSALDDLGKHMSDQEKELFVKEHCLVFTMNNTIVTSFRVGWLNPLRAGMTFVSKALLSSRIGWMTVGVAVSVALYRYYYTSTIH
mmetsp:Transcript_10357/g.20447  ORF Transcript_10357/g.20447 Transcript_10357/m.20447 type:complete len:271 (+) Transcript_10357:78-890(+)